MSLLKELQVLKEDAGPSFVIIHHAESETAYDFASDILKKFGFKDVGTVKDFIKDLRKYDVNEQDLDNPDMMTVFSKIPLKSGSKFFENIARMLDNRDYVAYVE